MISILTLLVTGSAIAGVLGAPRPDYLDELGKRTTPNGEGTGSDGFFWSSWSNGTDDLTFTNGDDGEYTVTWSGSGDIVVGKGWQTGIYREITYSGTYNPNGGSYLSVYGWFIDPLIEYYILEDFSTIDPTIGITLVGNLTSDGSLYQIYQHEQVNAPSIQGFTNFRQYWSIRQDKRVGGTINTAAHFNAWQAAGLPLGSAFHYQIVATEGLSGSGNSSITVSNAGSADAAASASPSSSSASSAAALSSAALSAVAPVVLSEGATASEAPVTATISSAIPTTPAATLTTTSAGAVSNTGEVAFTTSTTELHYSITEVTDEVTASSTTTVFSVTTVDVTA